MPKARWLLFFESCWIVALIEKKNTTIYNCFILLFIVDMIQLYENVIFHWKKWIMLTIQSILEIPYLFFVHCRERRMLYRSTSCVKMGFPPDFLISTNRRSKFMKNQSCSKHIYQYYYAFWWHLKISVSYFRVEKNTLLLVGLQFCKNGIGIFKTHFL